MKAIETIYNNYRFRSRIEARWAVFFDTLGVKYLYEHEGFDLGELGYYLPDFYIPGWDCYAEVKPCEFTEEEFDKCMALSNHCLLLDTGTPQIYHAYYLTGHLESNYPDYLNKELWMRVLLSPSKGKGRLWFSFGESPSDYWMDYAPELAATQARFEHGETP